MIEDIFGDDWQQWPVIESRSPYTARILLEAEAIKLRDERRRRVSKKKLGEQVKLLIPEGWSGALYVPKKTRAGKRLSKYRILVSDEKGRISGGEDCGSGKNAIEQVWIYGKWVNVTCVPGGGFETPLIRPKSTTDSRFNLSREE